MPLPIPFAIYRDRYEVVPWRRFFWRVKLKPEGSVIGPWFWRKESALEFSVLLARELLLGAQLKHL